MITDPARLLTTRLTHLLKAKNYQHNVICASHLQKGLDPELRVETIKNLVRVLKNYEFDAIAFQGISGALFAPVVALALDKTLLAVRKGTSDCHSSRMVEGDYNAKRYVIIDDLVATGTTVSRILEEIHKAIPNAECIGTLTYMWLTNTTTPESAVEPLTPWQLRSLGKRPLKFISLL